MNRLRMCASAVVVVGLCGLSPAVMAHPADEALGLAAGFAHPWLGWDHLLAMLAVGLWACTQQGLARWLAPGSFVGGLLLGLAFGNVTGLPVAEALIVASLVVGGLLLRSQPAVHAVPAVLVFALLGGAHGWAHRVEMPEAASMAAFAVGMVLASALLHALGMGLTLMLQRTRHTRWLAWIGALIAATGLMAAVSG